MSSLRRIRALCGICGKEWDDKIDVPKDYKYGYSLCETCGKDAQLPENSFMLGNATPTEILKYAKFSKRDREKYRGAPCNWCGEVSIGRIRSYNQSNDDELLIVSGCETHLINLKDIVGTLQ